MFDEKYGDFEDKLLEIINIMKVEKETFDKLMQDYRENQEKLRRLNDEIIVTKLEKRPDIGVSRNTKNYPSWIDELNIPQ
jgi:chromosome condensin MukBEF ATPase and DNA-binding subunit MukB